MKRLFDILFSSFMLLLLCPFFIAFAVWIALDSRGGVFYGQWRVGKGGKEFRLWKFRSMRPGADQSGELTIGARDSRITSAGYFLRKYKMDELPQLWNILIGDMSFVGPRPEVARYVKLYSQEQLRVLSVRPGLTDYASLKYFHENDILSRSPNPEETYIEEIMPAKLKLNLEYVDSAGFARDIRILADTVKAILRA